MTATLKSASANITTIRTPVLTAAAGAKTILIGGTVANVDATEAYHGVTIEIRKATNEYVTIVKNAVVSVGGSLTLPKIVLEPNEILYMTADVNSVVVAHVSYVEKS